MPLDADRTWTPEQVLTGAEIREIIEREHRLEPIERPRSSTAVTYRFADGVAGRSGSSTRSSEPFCSDCNRIRMTADGKLRTCLFSLNETDLRTPMRTGAER